MHKSKKETKGGRHDPVLTYPVCGHRTGAPDGGGCGGGFSFGCGWTLAPRGNLKIRKSNSNSSSLSHITSALNLFLRVLEGHDNQHSQGMTRGR